MKENFERKVKKAIKEYEKEKHSKPKYLIISKDALLLVRDKIYREKMFGLSDKKIYEGLYVAIDNDLEDYEFVILG